MSDKYQIPDRVRKGAHLQSWQEYDRLYQQSISDPDTFWGEHARKELVWSKDFKTVCRSSFKTGKIRWFEGGKLNVSENCLDRHLPAKANDVAIIHEGDTPGHVTRITYGELKEQVCRLANVLKANGVKKGDSVAIYMPMIPQAAMAMLACTRIGAVHSVVFGGFSAQALADRIADAGSKVLITADEGLRGTKKIPLKKTADEAVVLAKGVVQKVLVWKHTHDAVPWNPALDIDLNAAMAAAKTECKPVPMDAEAPLFLLYTSGSTGKPKGIQHCTGGYLLFAKMTHRYIFDYRPGDIYACVADVGWVTGHTYIVYGPLANGATTVMFESLPTYPDSGRYWDMVQRLKITQFYTAPTAIRAIARDGNELVKKYDRSSLRVLGSVGEPINPEAWRWYYDVVGEGRCTIVDTWWQTETGGIMITPLPGVTEPKPGSATRPFFGVQPVVLDPAGKELSGNNVEGILAIKASWPAMARTIYGDHQRYMDTYLKPYPGYYFTGDGCRRDEDGYYWITGRVDDVINVSGHRMGTAEVESALVLHPACAEAAVVGYPHEIKGQGIFAYVILKTGFTETPELQKALRDMVRKEIGPIATPDIILITPGLPKTRSGKIMRRILRKVAAQETDNLGDVTTLADPSIVQSLIDKRGKL